MRSQSRYLFISSIRILAADPAIVSRSHTVSSDDRSADVSVVTPTCFETQLTDMLSESVIALDEAGTIIRWNAASEALYGISRSQVLGKRFLDVFEQVDEHDQMAIQDWSLRRACGWSGNVRRKVRGTAAEISVWAKISLRRGESLEAAIIEVAWAPPRDRFCGLEADEHRYRNLFQSMPVGLTQVDASRLVALFRELREAGVEDLASYIDENPDFMALATEALHVEEVNAHNALLFGATSPEEMKGPITRYWQSGLATLRRSLEARYRGEDIFQEETRLTRLDGQVIDVLYVAARHATMPDKSLVGFFDISERKRAEDALRRSELRYQDLFKHMPIAVLQVNSTTLLRRLTELRNEGIEDLEPYLASHPEFITAAMDGAIIEQANEAALKLLGAQTLIDIKGPITRLWRKNPEIYQRLLLKRFKGVEAYEEEVKVTALDGRLIEGMLTVAFPPALAETGTTLNAFVDTTERKRAEQRVREIEASYAHAARVSMLGELTASIAHEINQPLAAITTNAEAGLRWLARPEPEVAEVKSLILRIVSDAQRAAGIIARVRAMALSQQSEKEPLLLDDIIRDAVVFLTHEFQRLGVLVEHSTDLTATRISADKIQLQQVVVNLALNAAHAVKSAQPATGRVQIRSSFDGSSVICTIEDAGLGIAAEHADQLFHSFFTTKPDGMGMGLPICKSIVEAHGGTIFADNSSSLGGARFTFYASRSLG